MRILPKHICRVVWKQVSRNYFLPYQMFSTVKRCIHTKFGWIWSSELSASNKSSFKSVENWNFAGPQTGRNWRRFESFWIIDILRVQKMLAFLLPFFYCFIAKGKIPKIFHQLPWEAQYLVHLLFILKHTSLFYYSNSYLQICVTMTNFKSAVWVVKVDRFL